MAETYPTRRAPVAHPIHGMLAAYPLTCFTGALLTDIAYADTAEMMWANFSAWLIAGGIAMGLLAAIAGIVDAMVTRRRRPRSSSLHSLSTVFMMAVALVNAFVHSRDAWTSVVPTGLVLSIVTAALAILSSWLGYSMMAREEIR